MIEIKGMIYGIGIDTEIIGRVGRLLADHAGYIGRVFTEDEQRAAENLPPKQRIRFFASAFSAKEAIMKALGTGWSSKVEWSEIEIPLGNSAAARLYGATAKYAEKLGVKRISVSHSETSKFVVATAIAEKD